MVLYQPGNTHGIHDHQLHPVLFVGISTRGRLPVGLETGAEHTVVLGCGHHGRLAGRVVDGALTPAGQFRASDYVLRALLRDVSRSSVELVNPQPLYDDDRWHVLLHLPPSLSGAVGSHATHLLDRFHRPLLGQRPAADSTYDAVPAGDSRDLFPADRAALHAQGLAAAHGPLDATPVGWTGVRRC